MISSELFLIPYNSFPTAWREQSFLKHESGLGFPEEKLSMAAKASHGGPVPSHHPGFIFSILPLALHTGTTGFSFFGHRNQPPTVGSFLPGTLFSSNIHLAYFYPLSCSDIGLLASSLTTNLETSFSHCSS